MLNNNAWGSVSHLEIRTNVNEKPVTWYQVNGVS